MRSGQPRRWKQQIPTVVAFENVFHRRAARGLAATTTTTAILLRPPVNARCCARRVCGSFSATGGCGRRRLFLRRYPAAGMRSPPLSVRRSYGRHGQQKRPHRHLAPTVEATLRRVEAKAGGEEGDLHHHAGGEEEYPLLARRTRSRSPTQSAAAGAASPPELGASTTSDAMMMWPAMIDAALRSQADYPEKCGPLLLVMNDKIVTHIFQLKKRTLPAAQIRGGTRTFLCSEECVCILVEGSVSDSVLLFLVHFLSIDRLHRWHARGPGRAPGRRCSACVHVASDEGV